MIALIPYCIGYDLNVKCPMQAHMFEQLVFD